MCSLLWPLVSLVEREELRFASTMMSAIFVPTRSLSPSCGFALPLPPSVRCCRLAICAAAKRGPSKNATPNAFRPSIPSILKTLNAGHASVAQVLESQSPFLKSSDWFALLEGLGKQNKWTLTLEVFRWIQLQKWYKHDDGFYSKLIVIMGKAKHLRMAVWLFNETKRKGSRPDTSLYNALITAHLYSKDQGRGFEKALHLFEEMKKKGKCQPNLVTYNILLRASAQACDVARVESFFKEMEANGIYPDLVSYNGVIGAYGKAGNYVQMEKILFVMRMQKHIKPDNVTYNTLIESYGRGKDFVKMEQVMKSMSGAQSRHKPDLKTYNILMSNYARAGEVEEMETSLSRMEAANFEPNLRSYEILMSGYGGVGALAKMRGCFDLMLEASIQPQMSTLNVMISAYCKHNAFEEAEELLSSSLDWQIRARPSSYLILLRAYAKENRLSSMERLVERMKIAGIAPLGATFFETLESFGLSTGCEEKFTASPLESSADVDDNDVADDVYDDGVDAVERSSSPSLSFSDNKDEYELLAKSLQSRDVVQWLAELEDTLSFCSALRIRFYHSLITKMLSFQVSKGQDWQMEWLGEQYRWELKTYVSLTLWICLLLERVRGAINGFSSINSATGCIVCWCDSTLRRCNFFLKVYCFPNDLLIRRYITLFASLYAFQHM